MSYDLFIGGMQDYNYLTSGIFELTLEIGCCKFPPASELEYFWIENKDALVNLLLESHRGEVVFVHISTYHIIFFMYPRF